MKTFKGFSLIFLFLISSYVSSQEIIVSDSIPSGFSRIVSGPVGTSSTGFQQNGTTLYYTAGKVGTG